ncbi:alpha,alpha-trehalase TreF [Komagataeibacter pomaceti]|nr:alpha,alpha-trehalase TreF [Novacetimonas pomaceti]MBV1833427.1 alpha,alpha-trehalase TreF [Novacetimonas pomaceti]
MPTSTAAPAQPQSSAANASGAQSGTQSQAASTVAPAHVDTPVGILASTPQGVKKTEPAGSSMVPPATALMAEAAAPVVITQDLRPPSVVLDGLFVDIAKSHIYADAKTAVDAVPDEDPADLLAQYRAAKARPDFVLKDFVSQHFTLPERKTVTYQRSPNENVRDYIMGMWDVLKRPPDTQVQYSSLLPLPYAYVVPGGRFSELYYWDSYFTMIGLYEDGKIDMMRDMIRDMASMIDRYGHIPNGSRTYYLSRSQAPFFSLMVDLLAMHDGQIAYTTFLPEMQAEYDYWMDGADSVAPGGAYRHVVRLPDGTVMNRHWDDRDTPRDESYPQDLATAASQTARKPEEVYRDLRAGSETGWDFSSRWLADGHTLSTIHTTELLTVELNCLIPHLAQTLAHAYALKGDKEASARYAKIAAERVAAVQRVLWDERRAAYIDYDWKKGESTSILSGATAMPLFLQMASPEQAKAVAETIRKNLLKVGGLIATERSNSGQQWDAPNGWAPLQWMAVKGLNQYGYDELASDIAARWMGRVIGTYEKSGVLLEKYDVSNPYISPRGGKGGGEYPMQIGFGWTNGTLLGLMDRYPQNTRVVLDRNPAADQPDRPTAHALPPMNAYGVQSDKDTINQYNLPTVTLTPRPVAPTPTLPQISSVGASAPTPPLSAPPALPATSPAAEAKAPPTPQETPSSAPSASLPAPSGATQAQQPPASDAATSGAPTPAAPATTAAPASPSASEPAPEKSAPEKTVAPAASSSAPSAPAPAPAPAPALVQPPAGASATPPAGSAASTPATSGGTPSTPAPVPTLPPHMTDVPQGNSTTSQPTAH